MLRAVIFDMDDTLLDWSAREGNWADISRGHLAPLHEYLQKEGYSVPDLAELVTIYGERSRHVWQSITPPEYTCPNLTGVLRDTLLALRLDPEKFDLDRVQRLYAWGPLPGVRPFEDALDVLRALRAANLKTGVLTNAIMPMWMRDSELKALGLLDYLDVRLTAGDVGRFKPHPAPFREALRRLRVSAEEAVFVGDRVEDDVVGAHAAGMRAVWVRRGAGLTNGSHKPNAIVNSLKELLPTLDLWYPGWRPNGNP